MPGSISGWDVAEALLAQRPGLKVLNMSGYTDDEMLRHGILEHGTAFIHKPFCPTIFAGKVRQMFAS